MTCALPAELAAAGERVGVLRVADQWSLWLGEAGPDLPCTEECHVVWMDQTAEWRVLRPLEGCWDYLVQCGEAVLAAVDLSRRSAVVVPSRPGIPDSTLWHIWLDQLLPAILDLEGFLTLHGGAVNLRGRGVLFLGASGAGKSTLTASLASLETPALSDDGVVVMPSSKGFTVEAVYPGMRLLPDARKALVPEDVPTSDVSHFALKKRIHWEKKLSGSPVSLAAIFLLGPSDGIHQTRVERLTPAEACMKLIEHSFALNPADVTRGAVRLAQAAAVASQVAAFRLSYPRDFGRLAEVHAAIQTALDRISGNQDLYCP